jgi:ketosteroid isomerase-like protein
VSRAAVVRRYLAAMEQGQLDQVLACFTPDGIIVSPVYGEVPVGPFYEKLFADTISAQVNLGAIYQDIECEERLAAQFAYVWERRDGSRIATDLVDLFEFAPGSDRIARLKIIFDTKPAS